jgi:2'-5' RNA ligase
MIGDGDRFGPGRGVPGASGPADGPGPAARGGRPAGTRRPEDDPPGTSRLFVATPVADDVGAAVGELMVRVAGAPIAERAFGQPRWVRVEGLHVTLRFLGATPDDRQPAIAAALEEAARGVARFEITLNGGGAFPNASRPRVLWIGIRTGAEELAALARRLDGALRPLGWPPEDRPFSGHLTLARTDGVAGAEEHARRLIEAARDLELTWRADRFVLYKSLLGHGPARYQALAEVELRSE